MLGSVELNLDPPSLPVQREAARQLVGQVDKICRKQFKRPLTEILPEMNCSTSEQQRSKRRKVMREARQQVYNSAMKNNRDLDIAFGCGESLNSRRVRRLAEEFETRQEAEDRTKQRQDKEAKGILKPKDRLGNFSVFGNFDREGLKKEVMAYEDGTQVTWKHLAIKYGVKDKSGELPGNAGQLVKLWLQSEGVDTERFEVRGAQGKVRRARIRTGTDPQITAPKKRTESQLREELKVLISEGEVPIGEFIVPKQYKTYFLDKATNRIQTKITIIEGRKRPLQEIREQLLKKQKPYLRDRTNYDSMTLDEMVKRMEDLGEATDGETEEEMRKHLEAIENTRHLSYWEDGASLANHGCILYLVATVFDEAIFLTNEEYLNKYNVHTSVQAEVEKPELYIIARCGGSDQEQLLYAETRRDDLPCLSLPVQGTDGRNISDVLRFFKGDQPSRQFEFGQQRVGHYSCTCPVHMGSVPCIWTCQHIENATNNIKDRQDFIMEGPVTSKRAALSTADPLHTMSKEEMQDELTYRGTVTYTEAETITKKELSNRLKHMLHGTKRVPTLLYNDPKQNVEELNIQHLEDTGSEPMHDLSNHTKNLLEELPARESKHVADIINRVKELCLNGKDIVRAFDMRHALLMLLKELKQDGNVRPQTILLIQTLADMQQLCYANAEDRSITAVFRMSNVMFLHHLMLKECLPGEPHKISMKKLWGHHLHSLRDHIPINFRVVAISSTMAENEERQFSTLKRITKSSANYADPDQQISNLFVRTHYKQKMAPPNNKHQQNKISQAAKSISKERTAIPINLLQKYPRDTQTYCESIADFLKPGYGVHWHLQDDQLILHDGPEDQPNALHGPKLHHFRSTSVNNERKFLQEEWKQILQKQVPVPASILWIYDGQRLVKKARTPFLDPQYNFGPSSYEDMPACPDIHDAANEVEEEKEEEEEGEVILGVERIDIEPDLEEACM